MTKISIRKARELYAKGKNFIMCASNLHPATWGINITDFPPYETSFDKLVNAFRYYNCINRETGSRVSFYVDD